MISTVRCLVNPTEDVEIVSNALLNLFPDSKIDRREMKVSIELNILLKDRDDLENLRQMIHDARIIDATRLRLERNWNGINTLIRLDKQVACISRIRVLDDSEENPPLGAIEIQLDFDGESEFERFVRWFTPPTKDGNIVRP